MPADLLAEIRQHPLFSSLSPGAMNTLAAAGITRRYPAGGFLTRAGEAWPYLFLVSDGMLKVLKESSEGRALMVAELGRGELFWGLAFFTEEVSNPVSLQFSQPTTLHLWHREEILPFLLEHGGLIWELSRLMVRRMLHASQVIEGLAFQPVSGRLARLLLDDFERSGDASIGRRMTLDEMAARVGTTREMVCRALYRFADKNLIDVTRTEFVLTDKDGLRAVSESS